MITTTSAKRTLYLSSSSLSQGNPRGQQHRDSSALISISICSESASDRSAWHGHGTDGLALCITTDRWFSEKFHHVINL